MSQLSHQNTGFTEKKFPLVLILDGVRSPANVGSLFRLADAFNIEKIVLCGPGIDLKSNRLNRTARSTVEKVCFEEQEEVISVCKNYQKQGYSLIAIEITEDSIPLQESSFDGETRIALIIGNERNGIQPGVLQLVQKTIHIEMFGKNSSMNAAQAAGIALYEITKTLPHI